jgi:hypothetical protein
MHPLSTFVRCAICAVDSGFLELPKIYSTVFFDSAIFRIFGGFTGAFCKNAPSSTALAA